MTIMVLELRVPRDPSPEALMALIPIALSYVLSFVTVGIFWVNHHHLLHTLRHVTGKILWLNTHLLFWLSLLPFITAYLGAFPLLPRSIALYALVLCMCDLSFDALRRMVARQHASDPLMRTLNARASRRNLLTSLIYLMCAPLAYISTWIPLVIFAIIPMMYFMPGPTIEKLSQTES
jgi:uncharacterized membrane protein